MDLYPQFLTTLGLLIDLAGVAVVSSAVIESEDESMDRGGAWMGSLDRKEELAIPPVQSRRTASTRAIWGLVLFAIGVVPQIWSTWLR